MNILAKILFNISVSLATEKVLRALIANALEQISKHTENTVDDELLKPIIEALRDK